MKSFVRKQIIWGAVFLFFASIFIAYTAYELNRTQSVIFGVPPCYNELLEESNFIGGLFNAYEYEVNKMIASPRSYSTSDIENNPLARRISEKTASIMMNSRSCAGAYDAIGSELELLSKSLRDINLATGGLIEAFSSSDPRNQDLLNVGSFTNIIQSAQLTITDNISQIKKVLASKNPLGSNKQLFEVSRAFLLILMLTCILFCVVILVKSYRVSRYLLRLKEVLFKIKRGEVNTKELMSYVGDPVDSELFELYDSVSGISMMVEDYTKEQKERTYNLNDELSRYKVISTYTTSIINSLSDGVMVTDDILKVSFVNASFEKFWRVKRTSIIDQDAKELPFIRLVKGWKEALSKVLYSGVSGSKAISFEAEYRLSEKTSAKKVKFYILPLKDSQGKEIIGTVTLTRPVEKGENVK